MLLTGKATWLLSRNVTICGFICDRWCKFCGSNPYFCRVGRSEAKTDIAFIVNPNTSTELRYNYDKKFETTGAGVSVTGDLNVSGISSFSGNVSFGSTATFGDDDQIIMGDGSDLKIYHDEAILILQILDQVIFL